MLAEFRVKIVGQFRALRYAGGYRTRYEIFFSLKIFLKPSVWKPPVTHTVTFESAGGMNWARSSAKGVPGPDPWAGVKAGIPYKRTVPFYVRFVVLVE